MPMKKKILTASLCAAILLSSLLENMPLTVGAAAYESEPSTEETAYLDLAYGASSLAAPTASRESGTITVAKDYPTVKLSAKKGTIYYSLNGGEYQEYTSEIKLTKNSTIKAYAKSGSTKSKTVTFKYKLKPKVDITVKKITGAYLVEFDTKVDRTYIYYTTDGSEPTTSSQWYRFSPLRITSTTKIRVLAVKDGWTNARLTKNVVIAGTSPAAPRSKSTADISKDPSTEISTETSSDGTPRWINITTDVSPVFAYSMKTKDLWYNGAVFDEVVFPSEINGMTVESVAVHGDYVNKGRIKSITIPDTVTRLAYVEGGAFGGCTSLTSLVLPDGITSIGQDDFRSCTSLKSINIPDGVTEIGIRAFMGCESLKSINIPSGVTKIKEHTFDGCKSLKSVTIPDGVTYLGYDAFANCTSLKSVTIPDSVEALDVNVFKNCTSLKSVTIPSSITEISRSDFDGCTSLKSVTLPDSMTSIGASAFANCTSLKSITIPGSVKEIGSNAFEGCTSLKSITISNGVTKIYPNAFKDCTSLESITLPNSVTEIGAGMRYDIFEYTYVDDSAFLGCDCTVTYKGKKYTSADGYEALYRAINGN